MCYLDRTSLAFAALQLCNSDWFNAKVYGLVSKPATHESCVTGATAAAHARQFGDSRLLIKVCMQQQMW